MDQDTLHSVLRYDPETGKFFWRESRGRVSKGDEAGGRRPDGYIAIGIRGRSYLRHRLVWLYIYGAWPSEQVDHVNGVRGDDRLINLREATHAENQRNAGKNKNNTSGFKGVTRRHGKWAAQISVNGKVMALGLFITKEGAAMAYRWAAERYHRDFART